MISGESRQLDLEELLGSTKKCIKLKEKEEINFELNEIF